MDFQELYEHAGKELAVGMADPRLLERARTHAGNVSALVPQIYCRSRAQSLEEEAGKASSDAHILELKELVAAQEHRMRIRKERYRRSVRLHLPLRLRNDHRRVAAVVGMACMAALKPDAERQ